MNNDPVQVIDLACGENIPDEIISALADKQLSSDDKKLNLVFGLYNCCKNPLL